ncbi:hypothetical protein D3C72_1839280 [compost metagenome]
MPVRCSSQSSPGCRIARSPRNLLMMKPLIRLRSCSSSSSSVPTMEANTPPLSMSATRMTGASAHSASRILTISRSLRLISAGLPAPSITTMSYSDLRRSSASRTIVSATGKYSSRYRQALISACGLPCTTTWADISLVGLIRMGFISVVAAMPQASA